MTIPRRSRGEGGLAASCSDCYAWGILPSRRCSACNSSRTLHPGEAECAGCRRIVTLKRGYCRLCWCQASADARGTWTPTLIPYLQRVRHHQLFFAKMQRQKARNGQSRLGKAGRRVRRSSERPAQPPPVPVWTQPPLFEVSRDFTAFDRRRHADLTNPRLIAARRTARALAEAHGWTRWVASDVDRALVTVLSGHVSSDMVRYSEMFPALRRHGLNVTRTAEVLTHLGLLDDDRTPSFESWLERKLDGLSPGIRQDVEDWLRVMHDGGPRTRARAEGTVWNYLGEIHPILTDWSRRYAHLREVTRDDVLAVADTLHGGKRHHTLSVLRSLFRHCKRNGTIFRDPAARVHVGRQDYNVVIPLQPSEIDATLDVASGPAVRVAIALAAIHAARPKAIRELHRDDVDLGNRRLTVAGQIRPLDDLTYQVILDWLDYRRARWPISANPHLIINQHTAMDTRPVSGVWITSSLRGQTANLERLRVDRQLDEALTRGPDPLHLAAVFGLDDKTAIRYANAARQILESQAELHETQKPQT